MELKVWVEGIQRIVCGVTEVTTCQDVVFALAHATGKTGRFTLIERWRNNERLLAPHENPLKILMKWGEYSSDVQFILQRSEQKKDGQTNQQQQQQQQNNTNNNNPQQQQQPNSSPPTNQQQQQQQHQNQHHPQSQQQILRQQQRLNQLNGNVDVDVKSKLVQSNNLKNSHGSDPSYGKQQQQQQQPHLQQQSPAELITNSLLLDRGKETRKSLNSGTPPSSKTPATNTRSNGTSGATTVVKVVDNHAGLTLKSLPPQQHQPQPQKSPNNSTSSSNSSSSTSSNSNNPVEATYASVIKKPKVPAAATSASSGPAILGEFNAADLRNSLDRKLNGLLYSNGVGTALHHGGHSGTTIVGATLKDSSRYGGHHQMSSNDSLLLDSSSISSVSSGGNHTLLTSPTPQNMGGSNNASPITGISSNGALVPPPYRDPPPPRNSPLSHKLLLENQLNNNPNASISSTGSNSSSQIISPSPSGSSASQMNNLNVNRKLEKDSINMNLALAVATGTPSASTGSGGGSIGGGSSIGSGSSASNANELLLLSELNLNGADGQTSSAASAAAAAAQYRDLVQLIKYQREKINTQQADLSKYDSEIQYLESRSREQQDQLDAITQEISKTDALYRAGAEQLQTLQYVEEEGELVRQQEKTLKSEITLLRSKLANCETELLQCKNKIRLLMDEIQVEQRKYCRQIQLEIDLAIQSTDQASKTTDKLKSEVALIEGNIADKKKQVEQLVHEMKEVNLQSLASVAPADEVRHLLEVGSVKPGSTRRMIGSPRQLENAVPTSKNPHGVWV